jgi:CubicO group peptidase (beta-lactamase class C family)
VVNMKLPVLSLLILSSQCAASPFLRQVFAEPALESVPTSAVVEADDRFLPLRQKIMTRVAEREIPSMSIAVAQGGRILWEESIGWADTKTGQPATPKTAYTAASIAKTLTAVGVLALVDDNILTLDEPAMKYLREGDLIPLATDMAGVTIRSLLTMTAGLPQGFKMYLPPGRAQTTRQQLRSHGGLLGMPVGDFMYSNYSFAVLELVIEGASGQPFDRFMEERVFAPLGMTSTYFETYGRPSGIPITTNEQYGEIVPDHAGGPAGGGGVRLSVQDLIRFGMFMAEALPDGSTGPLSPERVRSMRTPAVAFQESLTNYGLGVWLVDFASGRSITVANGHGRGGVGEFIALPEEGIAVATLMNVRGVSGDYPGEFNEQIDAEIIDVLVPGYYQENLDMLSANAATDHSYKPSSEWQGAWSGTVRDHQGVLTMVNLLFQEDGDIHVTLQDQYTTLLNGAQIRDGVLRGEFSGWMNTDEDPTHDITILVSMRRDGNVMNGYFEANFEDEKGAYGTPNFVRLSRLD